MEVVVTTGAIRCAKIQSNHHNQQTNIQKVAVWCSGNALVSINAVALHRARGDPYLSALSVRYFNKGAI